MKEKLKRIGYIVEWRNHGDPNGKWINFDPIESRYQKSLAIGQFTNRCKFHFIPKIIREKRTVYGWLSRRDLARCVPVFKQINI